ncbi:hypothetical protein AKJ47_01620 [candidate division MSBL1 archaeon SCGC-AAA261G05]|uniref:Orotate phosphoribosyltransferase n=2 Tax=candidate division MSBL1 TaxID=215777 RepID=A0A133VBJ3_9EURY|nr:hypothetical protein AKJ47_01620 [candidate division MSBL1 archaeon SCGC-AAA261G05]KXB04423.1 hypothetical protein AKJ48_02625 [candidate division MSBL1 archaeon SCGC-AAA261O19]
MNSSNEELRREVALCLHEVGGIQFGEFTLTSGESSPYYIDMRVVPSHPDLFDKFCELCAGMIQRKISRPIDKLAGVPTSGLPFSALVSHKLQLPMIFVRKGRKPHGRKKAVEGVLKKGDRVVAIDDVTTTGGSLKNAIEKIRMMGGIVEHVAVFVDREEGAREYLEKNSVQLHPCLKISELAKHLHESSALSKEGYSQIVAHLEGT